MVNALDFFFVGGLAHLSGVFFFPFFFDHSLIIWLKNSLDFLYIILYYTYSCCTSTSNHLISSLERILNQKFVISSWFQSHWIDTQYFPGFSVFFVRILKFCDILEFSDWIYCAPSILDYIGLYKFLQIKLVTISQFSQQKMDRRDFILKSSWKHTSLDLYNLKVHILSICNVKSN